MTVCTVIIAVRVITIRTTIIRHTKGTRHHRRRPWHWLHKRNRRPWHWLQPIGGSTHPCRVGISNRGTHPPTGKTELERRHSGFGCGGYTQCCTSCGGRGWWWCSTAAIDIRQVARGGWLRFSRWDISPRLGWIHGRVTVIQRGMRLFLGYRTKPSNDGWLSW